jgi:hypothetical protein
MKQLIIVLTIGLIVLLGFIAISNSGKDAAENADEMYKRSKVFQDSIANVIKTSMDEAAAPPPGGQVVPAVTPTGQPTSTTGK